MKNHPFLLALCLLGAAALKAQTPAASLPGNPPTDGVPRTNTGPAAAGNGASAPNPALPTIFIAGDSTAANRGPQLVGWGPPFADYFDPAKVNIVNRSIAGRSTRTFIAEGSWDKLIADVKKGDWVLIQFGHNDGSPVNEDASVPPERRRSR